MTDYAGEIAALIGSSPAGLVDFYAKGELPDYPDSRIRCLPFEKARDYTRDMRGIAVVERLGLWVLDDANDSNPYAYVSRGPCAGMVMHFSHDGNARFAYASLAVFIDALRAIGEAGEDIDEMVPPQPNLSLDAELQSLAGEDSEDAVFLICAYLGAAAPLQTDTQAALLRHEDFFVREALARQLARAPRAQDVADVRALAADAHAQVAQAGKAALKALHLAGLR